MAAGALLTGVAELAERKPTSRRMSREKPMNRVAAVGVLLSTMTGVACRPPRATLPPQAIWTIDGRDVTLAAFDWEGAVARQASVDFGCSPSKFHPHTSYHSEPYLAEGCGRRGVYVIASVVSKPNEEALGRFVAIDVSRPLEFSAETRLYPLEMSKVQGWRRLVVEGARDLACPEEAILPDTILAGTKHGSGWKKPDWWGPSGGPLIRIAEGCGKRAIYDDSGCPPQIIAVDP